MLFIDTTIMEVALICVTSFVGIFAVSASLEGYLFTHMPWYLRIVSAVGGLMLIYPGWQTDLIGVALVGFVAAIQYFNNKKAAAV